MKWVTFKQVILVFQIKANFYAVLQVTRHQYRVLHFTGGYVLHKYIPLVERTLHVLYIISSDKTLETVIE